MEAEAELVNIKKQPTLDKHFEDLSTDN